MAGITKLFSSLSRAIKNVGQKSTHVMWLSTQFRLPKERSFVQEVLNKFKQETEIDADFSPLFYKDMSTILEDEMRSEKVTIDLISALHEGLYRFNSKEWLMDLNRMPGLNGRTFQMVFKRYEMIHGRRVYIPWMSTTYLMVINKKAFDHLPAGLAKDDVIKGTEKWSYDALLNWAKNLKESTGSPKLGFPVGPDGLFYRFLHGYIYPSYTGAQVKNFDSTEAIKMWSYLKELWGCTNPSSMTWNSMNEPLLREEIWVGWNHSIRVKNVITNDKFVFAPAPRGPKGRGYILVVSGLSIPKLAPNKNGAWRLIDYLTRPETQSKVFENVGFLPTVKEAYDKLPEGPSKILGEGVATQFSALDAIVVMIPSIAAEGGEFNDIYMEAWRRIVLENEDPERVVKETASKLRRLLKESGIEVP